MSRAIPELSPTLVLEDFLPTSPCHESDQSSEPTRLGGPVRSAPALSEFDAIRVVDASGRVILEFQLKASSVGVEIDAMQVALRATESITLDAPTVSVAGDVIHMTARERTTRLHGADRLEAEKVEIQANRGGIQLKAEQKVRIDGSTIHLNDDPAVAPFDWSSRRRAR